MIYIREEDEDKRCDACGSYDTKEFEHNIVKGIYFTMNGRASTCVALCSECRQTLINKIGIDDGWGKLLEVK